MSDRDSSAPLSVRATNPHLAPETEEEPAVELPPPPERTFTIDGEEWIARLAGEWGGGTGSRGRARIVSILFLRKADPDVAVREALFPAGRFDALYDQELREIFDRAKRLPEPDPRG